MDEPSHSLPPGFVFARDFRIVRKIGEGGMGVVYAADQISTSKTRALKLMHATMVHDARLRDRFLQEAHAAAQIDSDHVAEVVAAGVDETSGTPWLAMELLRGETLDHRVKHAGPLGPRDILELGMQMRHALAQAHARGLVHRDLKPENLFVGQPRRAGIAFTLKVLDFGIAKWVQEARSVANSQVLGSPLWMAPEQWQPNAPIGPPTDVWALALVMFFALTGRVYWRTAATGDIGRIVVEVMTEPLAPPSARARDLGTGVLVPPEFDDWFLACLTRDPAIRLPDADVALGAFEDLFDGAQRSLRAVQFRDSHPGGSYPPAAGARESGEVISLAPAQAAAAVVLARGAAAYAHAIHEDATRPFEEMPLGTHLAGPIFQAAGGAHGSAPFGSAAHGSAGHEIAPGAEDAAEEASDALWSLVSAPLLAHGPVQRVVTALAHAIAEALSVEPVLVGLTEDLRLDRIAVRTATSERAAYDRAAAALAEVASRLGVACPPIYARLDQREPLRVEATVPPSSVLGPPLARMTPAAAVFCCAAAAAVQRPELRLRAVAPEVAQLRRLVAAATDIARRPGAKRARDMVRSVLQMHVVAGGALAACLDADGDACTDEALASWLAGADTTLARIGLLASGKLAAAAEALAAPPSMVVPAALDPVLSDLDAWAASADHAEARRLWGAPLV